MGDILRTLLSMGLGVLLGMAIMESKGKQHNINSDRNTKQLPSRK